MSKVTINIWREGDGWWVGECREWEIMTQARNLEDLGYNIEYSAVAHAVIHGRPIPPELAERWKKQEE